MIEKVSILGCGWLGLALAEHLLATGYQVYGSTTTDSKLESLREKGIKPFLVDISSLTPEADAFFNSDALIIAITSKNIKDFEQLLEKINAAKVQKIIFISSTSVFPNTNGIVTEESATIQSPLSSIEQLFSENQEIKSTIIRFGGLFGYDRKPGNFIKADKPIENPDGFINFIHRDDCVEIIRKILEKEIWNETLNACSESHPTRRAFYTREAEKVGKTSIQFDENSKNEFKIISSEKLKQLLDYQFIHADLMSD